MAPKRRATSDANVGAKRCKVAREVGKLLEKEDRLEFQSDMEWLREELEKNPDKMKTLKAVVKMSQPVKYNKDESFNPDLEGRSLARVPQKHLTNSWMPQLKGLTNAEINAIVKADSRAPHKILQRLAIVPLWMPLGPLDKKMWNQLYTDRVLAMGESLTTIKFNRNFEIDWPGCGHFQLLPPLSDECADPSSHVYTEIAFKGVSVPLSDDCVIFKGHWRIDMNWSHLEATLVNPARPNELKFLCSKFFGPDRLKELVPIMDLPSAPAPSKSLPALPAPEHALAIEDTNGEQKADDDKSEKSAATLTMGPPAPTSASSSSSSSVTKHPATRSPSKPIGLPGVRAPPKDPPQVAQAVARLAAKLAEEDADADGDS